MKKIFSVIASTCLFLSCTKMNDMVASKDTDVSQSAAAGFYFQTLQVDDQTGNVNYYHIKINPTFKLQFSKPVDTSSVAANIQLKQNGTALPVNYSYQSNNSIVVMRPKSPLTFLTKYTVNINAALKSASQVALGVNYQYNEVTTIDSTDKFPRITDARLLNLVQKNTFNYFWIWGHPLSGLAKERFTSDICTTGGTGFAMMCIPVAIARNFISRADGLARATQVVNFLDVHAQKYHGAFAHWINGNTGATIPFSAHDDGADLVETSYLMEGLLTVRQYFNGSDSTETNLRKGH
jgi:hypothetical protein